MDIVYWFDLDTYDSSRRQIYKNAFIGFVKEQTRYFTDWFDFRQKNNCDGATNNGTRFSVNAFIWGVAFQ